MRPTLFTYIVAISFAFSTLTVATEDSVLLDNGSEVVKVSLVDRDLLKRGESFDCSGSSQCHKMAASDCDEAKRQIQPNNRYFTGGSAGSTGVCAKRCGLFVSGSNCDLWGWEMNLAFDQLRERGCRICGVKTFDDGCKFKMDVVTGC